MGTLSGGVGVGIVAGSALLGAVITIVLRREPGAVLGVFLVLGTLIAGLAVRPRSARLVIPAPALSYVVAASVAGAIHDRAADTSNTGLLLHSGNWIATGFYAMTIATVLAIVLTGIRVYVDYRSRPRRPGRPARAGGAPGLVQRRDATGPQPGRLADDLDDGTRPVSDGTRPISPAGTAPRRPLPGSGPYSAAQPAVGQPGNGQTATGPRAPGQPGIGPAATGPRPPGQPGAGPPGSGPQGSRQYRPPRGDRYNFSSGA